VRVGAGRLTVPTDKGANAGLKVTSLAAGMAAGADSFDDMALLRHGGMGRLFDRAYAPSTLGSFLLAFTFGHVRQLDAVASRFLTGLVGRAPMLRAGLILNTHTDSGQDTLFDTWRFHAFFTTTSTEDLDTVAADKTHRGHAIIEQVNADLKSSALAHPPSGKFTANAAWLVLAVMADNLTRAAATMTGQTALAKATSATIGRTLIQVPARIAFTARRVTLHPPTNWPWERGWSELFVRTCGPPTIAQT
jgi:Transposase DDE domain group 1